MTKYYLLALAITDEIGQADTEDLSIVAGSLPLALRQLAEKISQGQTTLDLAHCDCLLIAGMTEEKMNKLGGIGRKN